MLTLASMVMFAFAFVGSELNQLNKVPMPVVMVDGFNYSYDEIDDAIHVPLKWTDSCNNQQLVVFYMARHYNNFRSGLKILSEEQISKIAQKWVCIK